MRKLFVIEKKKVNKTSYLQSITNPCTKIKIKRTVTEIVENNEKTPEFLYKKL